MWRRRKMKYLLSCLFCRVLSLVLHRFSCAELAAPAEMWDVDGALLCDLGGSAGISRDWQARGWLCWNWAPHQHQTWCFIWGKSQTGFSFPAVRNASCSVELMSVPSLLFLESDTYFYLLLAVVAAIIFFAVVHYLCDNWKKRAEFLPQISVDDQCLYSAFFQTADTERLQSCQSDHIFTQSCIKVKSLNLANPFTYTHPPLGKKLSKGCLMCSYYGDECRMNETNGDILEKLAKTFLKIITL